MSTVNKLIRLPVRTTIAMILGFPVPAFFQFLFYLFWLTSPKPSRKISKFFL